MGWAAVFAKILAIVGPLVLEWLRGWLDEKLAEARLPERTGDDAVDSRVALEAVRDSLWFWQFGKKRFVASLLYPVPRAIRGVPMGQEQREAIQVAAAGA